MSATRLDRHGAHAKSGVAEGVWDKELITYTKLSTPKNPFILLTRETVPDASLVHEHYWPYCPAFALV